MANSLRHSKSCFGHHSGSLLHAHCGHHGIIATLVPWCHQHSIVLHWCSPWCHQCYFTMISSALDTFRLAWRAFFWTKFEVFIGAKLKVRDFPSNQKNTYLLWCSVVHFALGKSTYMYRHYARSWLWLWSWVCGRGSSWSEQWHHH